METREFKFIKNILWPVPSTIIVSDEGIQNNKKFVKWEDIASANYHISVINGANNYIFNISDKDGKQHNLNFMVALTGKASKKKKMADLYDLLHNEIQERFTLPRANEILGKVSAGETVEIAKVSVAPEGVTIKKGMMKKEDLFLPWSNVRLAYVEGGLRIESGENEKDFMFVQAGYPDARALYAVLENKVRQN